MQDMNKTTIFVVSAMVALAIFLIPMAVRANRSMTLSPQPIVAPAPARTAVAPKPVEEAPATHGATALADPTGSMPAGEIVNVSPEANAKSSLPTNIDDLLRLSADERAVRDLASRVQGGSDLLELRDSLNGRMIRLGGEIRNTQQPARTQLGDG